MKRFFYLATAFLTLAACAKPDGNPDRKPAEDSIELSDKEKVLESCGGNVPVMVTSSGTWTLTPAEDYDWVSADPQSGADGDIVTFRVEPNNDSEQKEASFTFAVNDVKDYFKIICRGVSQAPLPELELKSEASVVLDYNAHEDVRILVYAENVEYDNLEVALSEDAGSWLVKKAVIRGETDYDGIVVFSVAALEGMEDRHATVTISAEGTKEPVTVEMHQEARRVLSVPDEIAAPISGGTVEVPVTANVAFSVDVAAEATWVEYKETKDGIAYFEASALAEGARSATVTFTQTDAREGAEPLTATLTITQKDNKVTGWAAKMNGNRLFPKWEGSTPGAVGAFTWELLFKVDEFNKEAGSFYTLMGIEDGFLLRFGGDGNKLQVVTRFAEPFECTATVSVKEWHHIAVTFKDAQISVYLDGVVAGTLTGSQPTVNIGPKWGYDNEDTSLWSRCLWLGYSRNPSRDFKGEISEVRVWTRDLTEEEINAPDHFYKVDPQSDGLYSYWKFTEGSGDYIEDLTGKGNPLYGETNVRVQGTENKGDAGIEWVSAAFAD